MSSCQKTLFGVALVFVLLILIPKISFAVSQIGLQDSDINVSTSPDSPEPNQNVTISLTSYATDLSKANIVWSSKSSVLSSGIGKTSYSLQAPGRNMTTTVNVSITPSDDPTNTITKQVNISPTEMETLWESLDGYTPPFYRGKSFPSAEGMIKIVAIPDSGSASVNKNVVYTWSNNGSAETNASGYNKNSYIFANNELNTSENITVSASSVDGSYNATSNVNIPIVQPQIVFYEKSPTEGTLFNTAIDNSTFVSTDQFTIVAVPYFLALKGNEDKFSYNWQINGNNIATPDAKTELTVHPTATGGYATINLTLANLNKFFQKATGEITLNM